MPLLIVLLLMLSPILLSDAYATLGGPPLDVPEAVAPGGGSALRDPDPAHARPAGRISGKSRTLPRKGYSIHEIQAEDPEGGESGQQIREYVLPDGTVFGVSWRGPGQPDLAELLGRYQGEFEAAIAARKRSGPAGRAPMTLRSRNMILQRSGHMRDIRGKAYLPELLPSGFNPEDIS